MANLNKVFLIGNLTRDPELRYVPSGSAVTTFTIATNRVWTSQSGEKKEEVCYVRVVVWAKMAEVCGEYLSKGSPVFVEGRLQSRNWETPQGDKRSTIEVIAERVQFLGRGKGTKNTEPGVDQTVAYDASNGAIEEDAAPKGGLGRSKGNSEEKIPF